MPVQRREQVVAAVVLYGSAGRPVFGIKVVGEDRTFEAPVDEVARGPDDGRTGSGEVLSPTVRRGVAVERAVDVHDAGVGHQIGNQRPAETELAIVRLQGETAVAGLNDLPVVEEAGDLFSPFLDANVVPAAGFDGSIYRRSDRETAPVPGFFQLVPGIAPAAEIQPIVVFLVLGAEADEKTFCSAGFACADADGIVGSGAGKGIADEGWRRTGALAQHSAFDLPVAALADPVVSFTGKGILQHILPSADNLNGVELNLGVPRTKDQAVGDGSFHSRLGR